MTTTAQIIADQIGKRTFLMLGAHSLTSHKDALSFKLRGSKACKAIKVAYEHGTDLYTIEGWQVRSIDVKSIGRHEGVSVDQMHQVIEALTGLATRL